MSDRTFQDTNAFADVARDDNPAVGLIVTPDNSEAVPARILRARKHGHETLVVAPVECEGLEFARALGATVIPPSESPAVANDQRTRLTTAARTNGYPGLIYHTELDKRIDFAETNTALIEEDVFVIEPELEPRIEHSPRVLVGIPAYNEADNVPTVVRTALQYADEVLVVDDGSDDGTAERAKAAGASVLRHDRNRGYGAALKTIFQQADRSTADHLVIVDGDGQHDVSDIPELVAVQRDTGSPIVIGSRLGDGADTDMPFYRRIGLGLINVVTNLSLGIIRPSSRIRDTQSGFRAYDKRAISTIAVDETIGESMDASIDILYHANSYGYDIEEVPTTIKYDIGDDRRYNPVQHGIMLIMNVIRTVERKRPITLLGVPGVCSVLIGLGFSYWAITNYIQSGSFSLGISITAVFFMLTGMLAVFSCIILHSLAVYHNR